MSDAKPVSTRPLENVAETLLYPLISRYVETRKEDGIIRDPKSVEIINALDYDVDNTKLFPISQKGACLRTLIFDEAVSGYLKDLPDGTVINLGCGLDTRFPRVDNGKLTWFDLDLPETIEIRKRFFTETNRHRLLSTSVLDPSWAKAIPQDKAPLILMEGLSFYLTETENRKVVSIIRQNFKNADFFVEVFHPFFITMCAYIKSKDPLDKKAVNLLRWGIKNSRTFETWEQGIRLVGEQPVIERGRNLFSLKNRIMFTLFPILRRMTKIVHLKFE